MIIDYHFYEFLKLELFGFFKELLVTKCYILTVSSMTLDIASLAVFSFDFSLATKRNVQLLSKIRLSRDLNVHANI